MGLAEGCVLLNDIKKDELLKYSDVILPEGRLCDDLKIQQDNLFG